MPDPLASLLVPHIYQSTDAAINEVVTIPASGPYTYKLGTGLTPAYPANLPLIPSGAAPLNPPPAMTAGVTLTTGALAANGNYQWAMTLVTKFGETTPGTILAIAALGAGVVGQTLNLPAGQTGTVAAPVIQRRIWRTKTTGSQLYLVAEIDDANVTTYVDEVSDTLLVTAAPTVNSSGLEGAVALSGTNGAGGSTWTEIAPGASFTTAGQFQVDYTVSATGGVLTFGSLDAGKTPTANYTAAALLGSAYFALVQAAFTTLHSFGIVQLSPASAQTGGINVTGSITTAGSPVATLNAQGVLQGATGAGTPTISNVPSGSTVTLVAGSNNFRGTIKVVVAPGGPELAANTRACTLTFGGGALSAVPALHLTPGSDIPVSPTWYYQNKTATAFDVMYGGPSGTNINAYYCDYVVLD